MYILISDELNFLGILHYWRFKEQILPSFTVLCVSIYSE
jgi:hypothetical protein